MDYVSRHRPKRWPRITVAAVAALVVIGGAFILGRSSAGGGASDHSRQTGAAVGPLRVVHDIPTGYVHSSDGAVLAASNWIVQLGRLRSTWIAQTDLVATVVADQHDASIDTELHDTSIGAAPGEVTVFLPITAKPLAYDESQATVAVWLFGAGYSAAAGTAQSSAAVYAPGTWTTASVTLRWVEGDWKVYAETDKTGPDPAKTTNPADFANVLGTVLRVGYVSR